MSLFVRGRLLVAFAFVLVVGSESVQAIDPVVGFPFGYSLGYQNGFRNRLPTPPYFSIYPPVYYGTRYRRPYGDSPYAAFPQLGASSTYVPTPAEMPPVIHRTIVNPHVHGELKAMKNATEDESVSSSSVTIGRPETIVNPFANEKSQVAGAR